MLVLALAINTDGFIRYSAVLEGNTADPKSLPDMVDKLIATNPVGANPDQKVLVVIDAGISSKENLELIKAKGYNYLCVSRKAISKIQNLLISNKNQIKNVVTTQRIEMGTYNHVEKSSFLKKLL